MFKWFWTIFSLGAPEQLLSDNGPISMMMWTIAEQCLKKFKYNLSLLIRRVWSSVSNAVDRSRSTSTTSLLESKVFKISFVILEWCCLSVNWILRKRPYWLKLLYTWTSAFVFLIWNSRTLRCPLMKCVITWKVLAPGPRWNSPYACMFTSDE